jgi:hypothetical protein
MKELILIMNQTWKHFAHGSDQESLSNCKNQFEKEIMCFYEIKVA